MVVGIARDDCPGCGYSEVKHSEKALERLREHELHPVDPLVERIEQSIVETAAPVRMSDSGFAALDPPQELATERFALLVGLLLLVLPLICNFDRHGQYVGSAPCPPYADALWFGAIGSLVFYGLALQGGFILLRRGAQVLAVLAALAALAALAMQPFELAAFLAGPILPEWWGEVCLVLIVAHGVWMVGFIQREVRAMSL